MTNVIFSKITGSQRTVQKESKGVKAYEEWRGYGKITKQDAIITNASWR
ncbi:hypothetical protein LI17339_20425 [Bacillus licheniformis LMG 17339]|nr:hypothetical protein LI17339_20425 [Bacillus licheniformis LMG 17339]